MVVGEVPKTFHALPLSERKNEVDVTVSCTIIGFLRRQPLPRRPRSRVAPEPRN